MNKQEFLNELKARGAIMVPKVSDRAIELAQNAMQQMHAAMMSPDFIDLFRHDTGGIILGDANIFGPEDIARDKGLYEIPSIVQINREMASLPSMRGRAIFGRNALFWFGFDAFGTCYMLDILNLNVLRKYDNTYKAILDCLAVGKI